MSTATLTMQEIPLKELKSSPTNPRKTFDAAKLKDLADSIKASGQLQPVLVRRWTRPGFKGYEVIAGERRMRAAAMAGLETLRCEVKELDDRTVAELQLVENVQRDDLKPMEEAEAYGRLVDDLKMKMEEIAKRTGKSRGYISGRLGLLSLSQSVRTAVAKDELPLTYALELRRVAKHEDQDTLLKSLKAGRIRSMRDLRSEIEDDYLLELAKASFSKTDANLVAAAGACMSCPKRTGHQPDLFGVDGKKDTCLDGACFAKKVEAHGKQLAAKAKAERRKVITGPEADKLVEKGDEWGGQIQLLSRTLRGLKQDSSIATLLKQYDPKHKVEIITAIDSHGKVHELARASEVVKVVPKSRFWDHSSSSSPKVDRQALVRKAMLNKASRAAWALVWPKAIEKLMSKPFKEQHLRNILAFVVFQTDYKATRGFYKRLEQKYKSLRDDHADDTPEDLIRKAKTDKEAIELLYHVILGDGLDNFNPSKVDDHTERVLKLVGIDFKKIQVQQLEVLKAAKAARSAEKKVATPKKKKKVKR